MKEIYVLRKPPAPRPMTIPKKTPKVILENKVQKSGAPFKPLPPPPFPLMNKSKSVPLMSIKTGTLNRKHLVYVVEGARGLNKVKLVRGNQSFAIKPAMKPTKIVIPHKPEFPSVQKKPAVKASGPVATKNVKKPRKKWLPSLGPPEEESRRILANSSAKSTWYCQNAELFSTVSTLKA